MLKIAEKLIRLAKEIIAQRKVIDKTTSFFKQLKKYKVVNGKQIYKDMNGKYYQFDQLHGHWQKYNKNGKHLGVANQEGQLISFAMVGRHINI